jgi:WD40 repeat protein
MKPPDTYPPAKDDKPAGDGIITADELYQYVRYQIELETAQRNKRQTPGLWIVDEKHDKGVYVFLTKHFDKTKLPPAPTLDDTKESNPYRGLESYEKEHSQLFFGRTKLIEELCDRVCERPLTVVLGASGSGKSSLVKAGLIPHLKRSPEEAQQSQVLVSLQDGQTHRHKHDKWEILKPIRPGESPAKTLENALEGTNLDTIPTGTKFLLVIDQFEELVTQCRDQAEREQFLRRLSEQLEKYSDRLHLVLTLRLDFEPQLRESVEAELKKHKNLASLLNAQQPNQSESVESKQQPEERIWNTARFIVSPMTPEELQEAIEAPAAVKAIQFDSEKRNNRTLVQQLINEVAGMPALPLLSLVLSQLYRKLATRFIKALKNGETPDRTITWADYDELGGVTQSVTKTANDVYQNLLENNPNEKDAYERTIRNVMLRMISLQGSEVARRQVPRAELEYPNKKENQRVETVIRCFQDARLIVEGTDSQDKSYVEPAHDALVRGWDKLKKWKQEQQEALSLQRELTPVAEKWKTKKQSSSLLGKSEPFLDWCDKRIDSVEDWLNPNKPNKKDDQQSQPENKRQFLWNSHPYLDVLKKRLKSYGHWFNQVETEFIQKSVWQRRRYTYLRWEIAIAVMLGLSGLTFWALVGLRDTQIAQLRILRQSTEVKRQSNQELEALLDVLQIGKLLDNWLLRLFKPDAEIEKLRRTLPKVIYTVQEVNRLEGHRGPVMAVDFQSTPNGERIVTTAEVTKDSAEIAVWHLDGRLEKKYTSQEVSDILKQSNGNFYKTMEQKSLLPVFNFSPDGKMLAEGDKDGNVFVFNSSDGTCRKTFKAHNRTYSKPITTVRFSHDSQMIAAGGWGFEVKLWKLDGTLDKTLEGHNGTINALDFSRDGQIIASASNDGTVKLWKRDGTLLKTLEGHQSEVWDVSISRDGQIIASASNDGTVKLWKRDGTLLKTLEGHRDAVRAVRFSADGHILASASDDGTVKLWRLGNTPLTILDNYTDIVYTVRFNPDGKTIATTTGHGHVKLWQRDGTLLKTEQRPAALWSDYYIRVQSRR